MEMAQNSQLFIAIVFPASYLYKSWKVFVEPWRFKGAEGVYAAYLILVQVKILLELFHQSVMPS